MSGRLNGRLNGSGEGVDARRGSGPRKISGGESGASETAGGIGGVGWREADGAVRSARKVYPDLGKVGKFSIRESASAAERVGFAVGAEFRRRKASKCSSRMRRTISSSPTNDLPAFSNFLTRFKAVAS